MYDPESDCAVVDPTLDDKLSAVENDTIETENSNDLSLLDSLNNKITDLDSESSSLENSRSHSDLDVSNSFENEPGLKNIPLTMNDKFSSENKISHDDIYNNLETEKKDESETCSFKTSVEKVSDFVELDSNMIIENQKVSLNSSNVNESAYQLQSTPDEASEIIQNEDNSSTSTEIDVLKPQSDILNTSDPLESVVKSPLSSNPSIKADNSSVEIDMPVSSSIDSCDVIYNPDLDRKEGSVAGKRSADKISIENNSSEIKLSDSKNDKTLQSPSTAVLKDKSSVVDSDQPQKSQKSSASSTPLNNHENQSADPVEPSSPESDSAEDAGGVCGILEMMRRNKNSLAAAAEEGKKRTEEAEAARRETEKREARDGIGRFGFDRANSRDRDRPYDRRDRDVSARSRGDNDRSRDVGGRSRADNDRSRDSNVRSRGDDNRSRDNSIKEPKPDIDEFGRSADRSRDDRRSRDRRSRDRSHGRERRHRSRGRSRESGRDRGREHRTGSPTSLPNRNRSRSRSHCKSRRASRWDHAADAAVDRNSREREVHASDSKRMSHETNYQEKATNAEKGGNLAQPVMDSNKKSENHLDIRDTSPPSHESRTHQKGLSAMLARMKRNKSSLDGSVEEGKKRTAEAEAKRRETEKLNEDSAHGGSYSSMSNRGPNNWNQRVSSDPVNPSRTAAVSNVQQQNTLNPNSKPATTSQQQQNAAYQANWQKILQAPVVSATNSQPYVSPMVQTQPQMYGGVTYPRQMAGQPFNQLANYAFPQMQAMMGRGVPQQPQLLQQRLAIGGTPFNSLGQSTKIPGCYPPQIPGSYPPQIPGSYPTTIKIPGSYPPVVNIPGSYPPVANVQGSYPVMAAQYPQPPSRGMTPAPPRGAPPPHGAAYAPTRVKQQQVMPGAKSTGQNDGRRGVPSNAVVQPAYPSSRTNNGAGSNTLVNNNTQQQLSSQPSLTATSVLYTPAKSKQSPVISPPDSSTSPRYQQKPSISTTLSSISMNISQQDKHVPSNLSSPPYVVDGPISSDNVRKNKNQTIVDDMEMDNDDVDSVGDATPVSDGSIPPTTAQRNHFGVNPRQRSVSPQQLKPTTSIVAQQPQLVPVVLPPITNGATQFTALHPGGFQHQQQGMMIQQQQQGLIQQQQPIQQQFIPQFQAVHELQQEPLQHDDDDDNDDDTDDNEQQDKLPHEHRHHRHHRSAEKEAHQHITKVIKKLLHKHNLERDIFKNICKKSSLKVLGSWREKRTSKPNLTIREFLVERRMEKTQQLINRYVQKSRK